MLDIKKTYEQYCKNKNDKLLKGLSTIYTSEAITQYTVLQFACFRKEQGFDLELLANNTAIQLEYLEEIVNELEKNNFLEEKNNKYFITDIGKNFVIMAYFYNLENQF